TTGCLLRDLDIGEPEVIVGRDVDGGVELDTCLELSKSGVVFDGKIHRHGAHPVADGAGVNAGLFGGGIDGENLSVNREVADGGGSAGAAGGAESTGGSGGGAGSFGRIRRRAANQGKCRGKSDER